MGNVSERVRRHRESLRAAGLRPIQIWVPDSRSPGFAEQCRQQSLAVRGDRLEAKTLDWLADVADTTDWK